MKGHLHMKKFKFKIPPRLTPPFLLQALAMWQRIAKEEKRNLSLKSGKSFSQSVAMALKILKNRERSAILDTVVYVKETQESIALELRDNNLDFAALSIKRRKLYFVCFDTVLCDQLDQLDLYVERPKKDQNPTTLRGILDVIMRRVNLLTEMVNNYFDN